MVPLVAKVPFVVSQPTFAYEGWLTVTTAVATIDSNEAPKLTIHSASSN